MKLFAWSVIATGVTAAAQETFLSHCCDALAQVGLQDKILYPEDEAYKQRIGSYFSRAAQLHPHCILRPHTALDVSAAVEALTSAKPQACSFAVRSGGHNHIPGASSIEDGVNIDLGQMNSTIYHSSNDTATVQPGATWGSVYSTLDQLGVMAAGGRSASVGVGGLVLGGGNSYYAAERGLVCDNVVRFEVVLASGMIVYASNSENSDLFQVLKGGGNNYGVVTAMDLRTFQGGPLWGGVVTYPQSAASEIFAEFGRFGDRLVKDPFASLITIDAYIPAMGEPFLMNAYEFTKPVENPLAFKDFLGIKDKMSDSTRITNMTSLASEWEMPNSDRVSFSTMTTMNDVRVLKKAHDLWLATVDKLKAEARGSWKAFQLYQPIPPTFGTRSVENGGNVLGLERFDETLIMYEPYYSWTDPEQDEFFSGQAQWLRNELAAYAKSLSADNEFIYLDYADAGQDPLASYGAENVRKMKAAARKYDPGEVFQRLVPGGFKLSKIASPNDVNHDEL